MPEYTSKIQKSTSSNAHVAQPFINKRSEGGFFAQLKESQKPFFNQKGEGTFFSNTKKVKPPFFSDYPIQTKLAIGQPGDKYEQEADLMADKVVQKLENPSPSKNGSVMRKPIFESENDSMIQTKSIENQLKASKGRGKPMAKGVRSNMESAFGADFSNVKVHTDNASIQMNQDLNSKAFTNASHVYFNSGEYNTSSKAGKRLLAHELTHVIQQRKGNSIVQKYDHTTVNGENLTVIADRYGVTVPDLRRANSSIPEDGNIQPGQVINIPIREHRVRSGDNLGRIARRYRVTVEGIQRANGLTDTTIQADQLLAIPGIRVTASSTPSTTVPAPTSPSAPTTTPAAASPRRRYAREAQAIIDDNPRGYPSSVIMERHIIVSGDTISGLAGRYLRDNNVTIAGQLAVEFRRLNRHVNNRSLMIGDCVVILKNWTHPNIGALPTGVTSSTTIADLPNDVKRAIATVYAEQWNTGTNSQLQQTYIWYSIRLRIETSLRGSTLGIVLQPGEFHGMRQPLFIGAMRELNSGTITSSGITNAKNAVVNNYSNPVPSDAGVFYFHWLRNSTSERRFNRERRRQEAALPTGTSDLSPVQLLNIERGSSRHWAVNQGWDTGLGAGAGWHKRIRSDGNSRIGSMYIFKGF